MHIQARGWAADEELTDLWPGECGCLRRDLCSSCRGQTKHVWYMCYAAIRQIFGRQEWHTSQQGQADLELLKVENEDPEKCVLTTGDSYEVHPKGLAALKFIDAHDWTLGFLAQWEETIRTALTTGTIDHEEFNNQTFTSLESIALEISYQLGVILEVAIYPGQHFDKEKALKPRQKLLEMDPIDLVIINDKFWEVNLRRFNMVPYIMGPPKADPTQKRMGWSVFYAKVAREFNMDVTDLMQNKSLAKILTTVHLSASEKDAA